MTHKIVDALLNLLMAKKNTHANAQCQASVTNCSFCEYYPKQYLEQVITQQQPVQLILPAFPAKSSNRQKTLSAKPDLGEVMSLLELNQLCKAMQVIYPFGVKLIICADGRVFNDLVLVDDSAVDIYQQGIQSIINQQQLTHLTTFSLDTVYPQLDNEQKRNQLVQRYAQSLAELVHDVKHKRHLTQLFNGIHRFIVEDQLALRPHYSKNQIRKMAKPITYEVIRRSNAWSRLLSQHFPNSLRLSIHPQYCGSDKLGIKLLPALNRWATPWHNVLLKTQQGWQLVKRREAEQLGATLNDDHFILEAS